MRAEEILKKAEEITGVAPKRWEKYGKVRYYYNYGSKNIYFSFYPDGRVEAKANRPGALTEIFQTLESFGLSVAEQKGNWTIWKKQGRVNLPKNKKIKGGCL